MTAGEKKERRTCDEKRQALKSFAAQAFGLPNVITPTRTSQSSLRNRRMGLNITMSTLRFFLFTIQITLCQPPAPQLLDSVTLLWPPVAASYLVCNPTDSRLYSRTWKPDSTTQKCLLGTAWKSPVTAWHCSGCLLNQSFHFHFSEVFSQHLEPAFQCSKKVHHTKPWNQAGLAE